MRSLTGIDGEVVDTPPAVQSADDDIGSRSTPEEEQKGREESTSEPSHLESSLERDPRETAKQRVTSMKLQTTRVDERRKAGSRE